MTHKTVVLPEQDDMLRRLKGVMDEPHAEKGFYSLLLKQAGTEKAAEGVALMFVLAIADYTSGLPAGAGVALDFMLPRFVAAIVDDEDVQRETLAFLQEAQS